MRWCARGIQAEARVNAQTQNEAKPLKRQLEQI
jgi:hypothetical protein